ncbi:hypothetical protein LCGC14_1066100 [marine sediment metagenome]|uniref:Uncharacterized protein n=1 Tax=marine sediment metagenome TaxID=412755 RepID=A0A0F9QQF5_9ZZZZ
MMKRKILIGIISIILLANLAGAMPETAQSETAHPDLIKKVIIVSIGKPGCEALTITGGEPPECNLLIQ